MELNVHHTYETRAGNIVTLVSYTHGVDYPWLASDGVRRNQYGSIYKEGSILSPHSKDLMREVPSSGRAPRTLDASFTRPMVRTVVYKGIELTKVEVDILAKMFTPTE